MVLFNNGTISSAADKMKIVVLVANIRHEWALQEDEGPVIHSWFTSLLMLSYNWGEPWVMS